MIQSVDRALSLLEEIRQHPGSTLTELSSKQGLLPSTAARLLATLEAHELVGRIPGSKAYQLGPAALTLGLSADGGHALHLQRQLEPTVRRLAAEVGEQVTIAVLQGPHAVNVLTVDGAAEAGEQIVLNVRIGRAERHLNSSALGKVLLAFSPAHVTEPIIDGLEMPKTAVRTITDRGALRRHLDRVRRDGYAISVDENNEHFRGVAAPVLDADGALACAIAAHGPTIRMPKSRLSELVPTILRAASEGSAALSAPADERDRAPLH